MEDQNNQINNPVPENEPPQNLPVEPIQEYAPEPPPLPPRPTYTPSEPSPVPEAPAYTPPVPDFSEAGQGNYSVGNEKPKTSILTVIVLVIATIIIVVLAGFIYYYATKNYTSSSVVNNTPQQPVTQQPVQQPVAEQPVVPTTPPTNIITFNAPENLPAVPKLGNCLEASKAEPYRENAYRCTVGTLTYDPCFSTSKAGIVFCQMNPASGASFTIKVSKPLPKITLPAEIKQNWAWFVKLEDGSICSPFIGSKPTVAEGEVTYGCRPKDKTQQVVLVGDLVPGHTWTAQEVISEKQGTTFVEKSSSKVNIDTVWQ